MHRPPLVAGLVLLGALSLVAASPVPAPAPAASPGSPSPAAATPSAAPSPQGPDQDPEPPLVVLRMETVGGFAPLQALLTRVPTFTLYMDGSVVYRPPPGPDPESALAPLSRTTLAPDQVADLLAFALREGGLAKAREDYQVGGIADATTTVFTISTPEVDKTVSAYALGLTAEGPDRKAYRRFLRLAELLADFDTWLPEDAEVLPYEAAAYRAVFVEDDPGQPDLLAWPWTDLQPSDLSPLPDAPAIAQADLTPEQAALITPVPSGGITGLAIAAPDGSAAWRLSLRPLLPDELPLSAGDDQAYELSG